MEKLIVIIISLFILAFMVWKEIKRENKVNLNLRLAASILVITAIYFITYPLTFQRKLDPAKGNSAVLLTEGFEKDSLTGLKNIPQFTADLGIAAQNKNVTFVPALEDYSRSQSEINKVHILGTGLEQHELEAFQNLELVFHPSQVSGFNSVNWTSILRSGDKLNVQGSFFKSNSTRGIKIMLKGLSTTLDSIVLNGNQTFRLSTSPKQLDKAVYSIVALEGNDTLANEKLPVIIEKKVPLRILLLSSSPDFESKFLKNWLYSEQYELAIRSTISKNKFSTEFLNSSKMNLSRISPGLLKNFDILIGDMAELSSLSSAETSAVQNQVAEGMGLIIRAESAGGSGFYRRAFNLRQIRAIDHKSVSFTWAGKTAQKTSLSSQSFEIVPNSASQALIKDSKDHIVVGNKLYGAGRILMSTVSDTYTWMLNNNPEVYSSFWSHIVESAARKSETKERWTVLDRFPVINEQVSISVESTDVNPPSASIGKIPLRFAQDASQLYRWSAIYWPSQSGWQSIKSGGSEKWWYAFDEGDWKSVRAIERIKNTARFINKQKTTMKQGGGLVREYTYKVAAIWFYLLFLVGCGYLWVEGKMNA